MNRNRNAVIFSLLVWLATGTRLAAVDVTETTDFRDDTNGSIGMLDPGPNTISGTLAGRCKIGDCNDDPSPNSDTQDSLTFTVPTGYQIASLTVATSSVSGPTNFSVSMELSLASGGVISSTGYLSPLNGTTGNLLGSPVGASEYRLSIYGQQATAAGAFSLNWSVTMTVLPPGGTPITFGSTGLNFSVAASAPTQSQLANVTNRTGIVQAVSAKSTVGSGQNWLTTSVPSPSLAAYGVGSVVVTVDPSRLTPGVYSGSVTITVSPAAQTQTIPIVVTVGSGARTISLSQTGLYFETIAGGASPQPQSFRVFTSGTTPLLVSTAVTSKKTGTAVPVATVQSAADSVGSTVNVSFNTNNVPAGTYYLQVSVIAPGAENSPQQVTAVVNVQPANTPIDPELDVTGLIFVGGANGVAPAEKIVNVSYAANTAIPLSTTTLYKGGTGWLAVQSSDTTIRANQPAVLRIRPVLTGLTPGAYKADVTVKFSAAIPAQHVSVVVIVLATASADSVGVRSGSTRAASCVPTTLYPVFTKLGVGFTVPAGWPAAITVSIVDDCGLPQLDGTVNASFLNGDPPLSLLSQRDGTWSATWQPQAAAQTAITVRAQLLIPAISGTETLGGEAQSNSLAPPSVDVGGVVSAASNAAFQPLAPGAFISIYGKGLSNSLVEARSNPYETTLAATQVFLGDRQLPLKFVFERQINAIIPYDVPLNTTQQLVVINGDAISIPQPVVITAAQPALFTKDLSGKGEGIIVGVKADQSRGFIISPSDRVTAGDFLVIYVAGLGAVDNPVAPGAPAPNSPLSRTINPVTVTIGGKDVGVADFAGLAPGFPGVYQVNVKVPAGIAPGTNVELIVTSVGKSSTPVTISIQ